MILRDYDDFTAIKVIKMTAHIEDEYTSCQFKAISHYCASHDIQTNLLKAYTWSSTHPKSASSFLKSKIFEYY